MTEPLLVMENGEARWLGVRFRPGGAAPFFRFQMREVTDSRWDLGTLWSVASTEWVEKLGACRSLAQCVSRLNAFLERELDRLGVSLPKPLVTHALRAISRGRGTLTIERLSTDLAVTRQHLNRLFHRHVGVSVKLYSRIVRLNGAIRSLGQQSGEPSWAALAAQSGYFDQSHLIADFTALTGLTPAGLHSEFIRRASES